MAEGGCIGEFPHNVIGDELLPLRVVVDKCLDVLLQESARDCHLSFLVHLLFGVKSENRFYRSVRERCSQNWIPSRQNDSVSRSVLLVGLRRFGIWPQRLRASLWLESENHPLERNGALSRVQAAACSNSA